MPVTSSFLLIYLLAQGTVKEFYKIDKSKYGLIRESDTSKELITSSLAGALGHGIEDVPVFRLVHKTTERSLWILQ